MNISKNMILDRLRTIYDSCGNEDTKKQILDLIIDIGKDNNSNLAITWDNGSTIKGIPCDYRDYNTGPGVGPHTGTAPFNGYTITSNSKEPEKYDTGLKLSDVFPNLYTKKGSSVPLETIIKHSDESSYAFKDDDGTKGLHTQK